MNCTHHYVVIAGRFKCKKCGHVRPTKNRNSPPRTHHRANPASYKRHDGTHASHATARMPSSRRVVLPKQMPNERADKNLFKRSIAVKNVWLGSTSGLEFEEVCADIFGKCGFATKKIGGTADGGRDVLIWNDSGKVVVECKHHAKPVGRPVVQKLHSAVMTENAVGGVLISTGGFSAESVGHPHARSSPNALNAVRHVRSNDIILVDLDGLRLLARDANVRAT